MTIVKADGNDLVHSDGRTAGKAIELIKKHKDEPFFLAVGFVRPHTPLYAPKHFFELFPLEELQLPVIKKNDVDNTYAAIKTFSSVNSSNTESIKDYCIKVYLDEVGIVEDNIVSFR